MTRIGADPSFRQLVGAALSFSPRARWAFGSRTATGRPSAPSPESVSESPAAAPSWSIVNALPRAKETVSPPPFEEVVWKSTVRSLADAFAAEDFAAPPGAEIRVPPNGRGRAGL